jgi:ATP-binding cassette subfamily E protein 1
MKRIVVIDKDLCKFEKCGYKCVKACPVNRSGKECVKPDPETNYPVFNEELCVGCGICVRSCEKIGFDAISLVNLPAELDQPIHRYGKNGFAIYRLPIPRDKMVVGLIGANGVGKTTVLNILSGKIKPNAGSSKASWDVIIEKFKGTELQNYIEKLKAGGLKIAYKPQYVDAIPSLWKGSVSGLFKSCDQMDEKILDRLDIRKLLDKKVAELSGGELQLVAITTVLMKKADLYFFDEPSSYLDVKQRLIASREIRNLAEKNVVMAIEHDLAILDYLSDHVHILYGKPGTFGVVSKPYGVRVGINTYLEGYIKEDNVRFRDHPVFFSKRAKASEKIKPLLKFSGFEKKFKGFELNTEQGDLFKGEIVGILGPNATGKTTFIKMLSGELKPDKGGSITGLRISVKPQRLVLSDDEGLMTVGEFLAGSKSKLCPDTLMERQMSSLSGGELQSIFITKALGSDHDILFLDEPSAFLDVEQRLAMVKVVREHIESKGISAFVVDHDLQVIDAIADRVMVFEGDPSVNGFGRKPCSLYDGMNVFLKTLGITFRRDPYTGRPRVNKQNSQKDLKQKAAGEYYYIG